MLLLQISYVYQTQTKTSNNEYTEDEPIPKSNLSQKRSVVEDGYFFNCYHISWAEATQSKSKCEAFYSGIHPPMDT